ncbi:MAG: hypothetical protein KDB94_04205 [Acidobacteria bacterium]|nr:hypothetical protein [Acidobacteriota bacterium]
MRARNASALAALAVLLLAAGPSLAKEKGEKEKREVIQANVINLNSGPRTGMLTIYLDNYTSDDDAKRYLEAFNEGGQDALVALWQKERPVAGRIRFATTLGYDLRLVRSIQNEKGRLLRLVTDRPIQAYELRTGARSEDYPIGWIEIQLDAEGKGEGQLIAAAELTMKDGNFVVKSFGAQPVRITNAKLKLE